MELCKICNTEMNWMNDFDFEDCGYEGEGIVSYQLCPKCEVLHEVLIDFEKEEKFVEICD